MTHNTQLLIATERERWLKLHLESGLTITELSKRSGFCRDTLHEWRRRYLKDGLDGLFEKSRAHHSYPTTTPDNTVELVRAIRLKSRFNLGAKKIAIRLRKKHEIQLHWQTVHQILKKEGLIKKRKRLPSKTKWVKKAMVPGELVQIDVVYVRKYKGSWLFQFSAIDGATRWKYSQIFTNQSNVESLAFLKNLVGTAPFTIKGIQTDNASIFTNRYVGYIKSTDPLKPRLHEFDIFCENNGITHYLIDPGKPAQNGKIERSNRSDREELWNHTSFDSVVEAKRRLKTYLKFYNEEREHLGIGGLTPAEKLKSCRI
jgi:transposase InsO family protein